MIEVVVAHLGLDRTTNAPVVILREKEGARMVPIWIGPSEASAIAMELQGFKPPRPMTHDLLRQVLLGLGADLQRVVVTAVKGNTYFAELHLRRGDDRVQVDARPSDGIALAVRTHAPIFTSDELLAEAEAAPSGPVPEQRLDAEQLKRYLENLDPEDFGKFQP
ncbi:MAG TPA: bifunctional nuclease family protein [Gemmatimonadales bacterium]|nr:bifunctional nuclease family protein [Gemmatimonadales bacterium]